MKKYTENYMKAFAEGMCESAHTEARALIAGADSVLAVKAATVLGKPRRVGPFLTEERTVAVNAQGKRLPHNARGLVAPGKPSQRGKAKAHMRARVFADRHASYIDRFTSDMSELRLLIAQATHMSNKKRKALRSPIRAIRNRIAAHVGQPGI